MHINWIFVYTLNIFSVYDGRASFSQACSASRLTVTQGFQHYLLESGSVLMIVFMKPKKVWKGVSVIRIVSHKNIELGL